MKQIFQDLNSGEILIEDVPIPSGRARHNLVVSSATLVSAGTERMLLEFGKANLLDKARQQPDKVRAVFDKVRTDGLIPTLDAVRSKLDQPLPLGYCNVGLVTELGEGVRSFRTGDRVVSNGQHAEYVRVPTNLCAAVPDSVPDEHAVFTVLASIGLQGIRLANPTLGECVVVTGLGLVGLLTVQMLRAQGCRVMGIDFNAHRLAMAQSFGAEVINLSNGEDPLEAATVFSRGRGVDAVLITASSKSNEPVSQAAKMCRKRGRIVLVGVTGLELSRADFFEKELTFQVSCSYGPGRYDSDYEENGHDYPVGFVRWTEQRNFEAVLDLIAAGQLDVGPLISHRFPIDRAVEAYDLLGSNEPSLGILLEYGAANRAEDESASSGVVELQSSAPVDTGTGIGVIGAGNYAGRVLLPAFEKAGSQLHTIVSSGGASGVHYGKKHGFSKAATDVELVFTAQDIASVIIATRHDSHADYVLRGIEAKKHVFVEKPLCLTLAELDSIEAAIMAKPAVKLMVGFNRRFSPLAVKMKALLEGAKGAKSFIMTVNAGRVPDDHWTQDLRVGGGRINGEACHFIDLLRNLAGSAIVKFDISTISDKAGKSVTSDKATIVLNFEDGSMGTVHYLANGHSSFPKERLEVFVDGKVLQLDNFRRLRGWGWKNFTSEKLWRQDKGQNACVQAFVDSVTSGEPAPISLDEILEVSRISIELGQIAG